MKRTYLKVAVAVLMLSGTTATAQEFDLTFQSVDPAGNPNFAIQKEWTERVHKMSGGRIAIELLPVGSVVEYNETQEAVGSGILDGHITDVSYFSGKDPAFGLIANPIGAWASPDEMFRFINYGGGYELMNELEGPYGLRFVGATTTGLEGFVSDRPLDGVADLKGLKVRAPEGLIQEVFAAAGAVPVNLPYSEVYTSLDKGVIDAADSTVFSTNHQQGLHKVAVHPVYPGFHSMPLVEVAMNLDKWNSMPEDLQEIMTVSVRDFAQDAVARLSINDLKAVAEAKADPSITVHNWPAEERAKFRAIAMGQWSKVAASSENAQKVYDLLTEYLKSQGLLN
ncbi:TRAP transporter substrate-binding protein [Thalassospira xianhensis]|uniref:C4-dicarboxylate ABC transporter substrate-binding protein n=1 Tax=Thalassospira xianhensis MCCC 1A02616 TaxID=1177929 RepID=A0A367U6U9_9PROT|nr:TRAP transporter substrate-binding protein [Thalassospira xianhensis]RCK04017.1 C4-dicarboxylate ABC transporter substrate-binding protein [Thalassospira xianhensis MCCC 1A02616]UKV13204.1 TRAP transporter substrate-binding protein [Thalassospiraceae bacterium SW-3-3]